MPSFFAWVASAIGPIVARVLLALGLTIITVKGADIAFDQVKQRLFNEIGSLPNDIALIGGLFGVWEGMGLVIGAASFVVSYMMAAKFFSFFGAAG